MLVARNNHFSLLVEFCVVARTSTIRHLHSTCFLYNQHVSICNEMTIIMHKARCAAQCTVKNLCVKFRLQCAVKRLSAHIGRAISQFVALLLFLLHITVKSNNSIVVCDWKCIYRAIIARLSVGPSTLILLVVINIPHCYETCWKLGYALPP